MRLDLPGAATTSKKRVAVVCDWLVTYAGAERVVEEILQCVGDADIFTLVDFVPESQRRFLGNRRIFTSFIQNLPFSRKHFRSYLPLFPQAIERFDLSSYDLVISSSHAVAKGVIIAPGQTHICYCHTPIRYAWDMESRYLGSRGRLSAAIIRYFLHRIRIWDVVSAARVDVFLANSNFVKARIAKFYRRDSEVLFPPVDISGFLLHRQKENFFLTAARQVPYKKIDIIVEAFRAMPDKQLVVAGDGPGHARIRAAAAGAPNIRLVGHCPPEELRSYMQRAKAFVFAAKEDFGIVCLEAQACGTPVIAYGAGGSLDTIRPLGGERPTGIFFMEQSAQALRAAVGTFEDNIGVISSDDCRAHAEGFSKAHFREGLLKVLERVHGS